MQDIGEGVTAQAKVEDEAHADVADAAAAPTATACAVSSNLSARVHKDTGKNRIFALYTVQCLETVSVCNCLSA